jgi:cellulose synthase/poly-beta-1,6-N-acetylglucosamine synthase-like glycosyltransferase
MHFSIIIPAYKEKGIHRLVETILSLNFPKNMILDRIILVVCGYRRIPCFKERKVILIKEKRRMGKAFAINLGLKMAKNSDVIVVASGDILIQENSIIELLKPFSDPRVGMTCGRPVPINDENTIIGFVVHLIWNLHHLISLIRPKAGELVAFRNIIEEIPRKTAVDEASIEAEIYEKNYIIKYVPSSLVFIKGPETISDLIKQRKRIFIGHLHLKNTKGYEVSTMNIWLILINLIKIGKIKLNKIHLIFFATLLEIYIRLSSAFEFYVLKKNPYKWEIIKTAKINMNEYK